MTYIVLYPVNHKKDGRPLLESIEGQVFISLEAVKNVYKEIQVYTLSEFMDLCNDQELILDNFWVGYINVEQ